MYALSMKSDIENLKSDSTHLSGLLNEDPRFVVPDYQRSYAWEKEQWEDFWNDLQSISENETHFFGTIVLVRQDKGLGKEDLYEIVDGQQRLTTVLIFLTVLKEKFDKKGQQGRVDSINQKFIWSKDNDHNKRHNLNLNDLDNQDYTRLIEGRDPTTESLLVKSREYFREALNGKSTEDLKKIQDKLLKNMPVIKIQTSDEDSAFKLFETLNDRGKDLSKVDLMKKSLLEEVERRNLDHDEIKQEWENIIQTIRHEVNKQVRFFTNYMMYSPRLDIHQSVTNRTIVDVFESILDDDEDEYGEITIGELVNDMREKAGIYERIINSDIQKFTNDTNSQINYLLENMENFGATRERTLFLFLLSEVDNESKVRRGLKIVESFNVRESLTGGVTGRGANKLYANVCSQMDSLSRPIKYLQNELSTEASSDEQLRRAIKESTFPNKSQTKYLLRKFERRRYQKSSMQNPGYNRKGHVEHIAPKRSFTADKYSEWVEYLDMSESEFDQYRNKIGNKILLEERLNLEAGLNPFEKKKSKYEDSDFAMADSITEYDEWKQDQIDKRTEELAQKAPKIWDFDF